MPLNMHYEYCLFLSFLQLSLEALDGLGVGLAARLEDVDAVVRRPQLGVEEADPLLVHVLQARGRRARSLSCVADNHIGEQQPGKNSI